jgi:hypothetical protein
VTVRGCPVPLRQLAVRGLGHEAPTLLLTNNHTAKPAKLIDRYAKRMTIEQRLAEQIRSFHLDALSSAVALNVDLDTTLTVWAQAAYDALRRRLPGYATATPTPSGAGLCPPAASSPWAHRGCGAHRRAHLQPGAALRRPARGRGPLVGRAPAALRDRRRQEVGLNSLFENPS